MFNQRRFLLIFTLVTIALTPPAVSQQHAISPNTPAVAEVRNNIITITYQQQQIFRGELSPATETLYHRTQVFRDGDKIQQLILLSTLDWNKRLKISGKIFGSAESFPCEADRSSRGPLVVRHASGLSRNLRNRAVYDRRAESAGDRPAV